MRLQIIKKLTGKRKREEKIFSSQKTSLKDSMVEFCENLAFAEVAMVPLPFLFFLKESTVEMLDMLSKRFWIPCSVNIWIQNPGVCLVCIINSPSHSMRCHDSILYLVTFRECHI